MRELLQQLRVGKSLLGLVRDMNQLGEVFSLTEALMKPEYMEEGVTFFSQDPDGARALEERPRLGQLTLEGLLAMPEGSLGRAFARHLESQGLDPSAIPAYPADEPRTYLRAHLFETHDLWHTVTGFGSDVPGELGLQAFYLAQLPSRLSAGLIAAGLLNAMLFEFPSCEMRMNAVTRGWQTGKEARPLFGAPWATLLREPLRDVRARYRILTAEDRLAG